MKPKYISRMCIKLSGNFSDLFIIHGQDLNTSPADFKLNFSYILLYQHV